jgi:hypothetical protein
LPHLTASANLDSGWARSGVNGPLTCGSSSLRLISISWSYSAPASATRFSLGNRRRTRQGRGSVTTRGWGQRVGLTTSAATMGPAEGHTSQAIEAHSQAPQEHRSHDQQHRWLSPRHRHAWFRKVTCMTGATKCTPAESVLAPPTTPLDPTRAWLSGCPAVCCCSLECVCECCCS